MILSLKRSIAVEIKIQDNESIAINVYESNASRVTLNIRFHRNFALTAARNSWLRSATLPFARAVMVRDHRDRRLFIG